MGHVSNNAKREQGLLARLLFDQGKVTARFKALALGPGQSFWCPLHPQASHSHSLPSLWCTLQLFADHIPTLLSLLSLDSPFSPFFNVFALPSAVSKLLLLAAVSSLQPCPLRFSTTRSHSAGPSAPFSLLLSSLGISGPPTPSLRDTHHHGQCRQTAPAQSCHGFAGSQGFGCCSTHERSSIILHSRLGCTIKA